MNNYTHEYFTKDMLRAMYRYIQIANDPAFSKHLPATQIAGAIAARSECIPDRHHAFKNSAGLPWFRINVTRCDSEGNYPGARTQDDKVANMVELICEDKGEQSARAFYDELAQAISADLEWKVINHDDA